jgi:hypothetical protein
MSDAGVNWGAIQALVDAGYTQSNGTVYNPNGTVWNGSGASDANSADIESGGGGVNWGAIQALLDAGYTQSDGTVYNPDGSVWGTTSGGKKSTSKDDDDDDEDRERANRNIIAAIRNTLSEYGFDDSEVKQLTKLMENLIEDDAGEAEILLKIRESKPWKERFKGNEMRRQAGLSVLSPEQYLSYEREAHQRMREAGLPPGFYDDRSDYHDLIGKDISINELTRRIQNGYVKVANAAPEIRSVFAEYFGANGDAALASMFLDYDKAVDVLERNVAAATFGGTAKRYGFNPDYARSKRAADIGIDQSQAEQGFEKVLEMKPLFEETVVEQEDLTAEDAGFATVFGFDAESSEKIRKRREARIAGQSGSTQGSVKSQTGYLGLAIAR